MKKVILYSIALIWSIIGVFTLNLNTVNAADFFDQQGAGETWLSGAETWENNQDFITSLKRWVGWLMTILAVITMFILVYGGIIMITAAWDEDKYKKWFTILKQAAVGLIFLGLAWMFIMLVFFVINKMVTPWG